MVHGTPFFKNNAERYFSLQSLGHHRYIYEDVERQHHDLTLDDAVRR
jgi:hypothetical protein